jgi:hypothetical protein
MTSEKVSSVVLDILENNRKTGKSIIESYRKGGIRLTHRIESGWEKVIDKGASRLDKKLRAKLVDGGHKLTGFWSKRVATVSDTAEKALDKVYDGATKAFESVKSKVEGVDNKYASQYFTYVGKAALPGAKLALDLSARLADGTDKLYGRIAPSPKAPRKTRAKRTASRAKKSAAA